MKHLYMLAILCAFLACSNSKNAVSDSPKLQISDVTPGRSSTALLGKILSTEQTEDKIEVSVSVISMRQGGVTAPAFAANSKADIVLSANFQKNYLDQHGQPVTTVLDVGDIILTLVNRNLRSKEFRVIQLKTE